MVQELRYGTADRNLQVVIHATLPDYAPQDGIAAHMGLLFVIQHEWV